MSDHPLLDRARQAPARPGVYQFADARGRVIYVGKAKHLKKRVLSYFTKGVQARTAAMLARARRLEFVVTATEIEALILENRLIKQHRPRYNINLRDDKTYPYVLVTTAEPWPRALLTRLKHHGVDVRELDDPTRCCGSAGIYNLTHPVMSRDLLDRKMDDVKATGAEVVVSANPGCLLQLEWGAKRTGANVQVKHVTQVLLEAIEER